MKKLCLFNFSLLLVLFACKPAETTESEESSSPIGYIETIDSTQHSINASNIPNTNWLNGEWFYGQDIITLFDLKLLAINDSIVKGQICCSLDSGERSDCSEKEDDFNLIGIIKNGKLEAVFHSIHSPDKEGNALIRKISENEISWLITKAPDGKYDILENATLIKIE